MPTTDCHRLTGRACRCSVSLSFDPNASVATGHMRRHGWTESGLVTGHDPLQLPSSGRFVCVGTSRPASAVTECKRRCRGKGGVLPVFHAQPSRPAGARWLCDNCRAEHKRLKQPSVRLVGMRVERRWELLAVFFFYRADPFTADTEILWLSVARRHPSR